MKLDIKLIILLIISSFSVLAQSNEKIQIEDFNNDGFLDTLTIENWLGTVVGGTELTFINGKNDSIIKFSKYVEYWTIKNYLFFPDYFSEPEYIPFYEKIKELVLPEIKTSPDPSLEWIISGTIYNKSLENNKYFDLVVDPKADWNTKPIIPPSTYCLKTGFDTLYYLGFDTSKIDTKNVFLEYRGHNHYNNSGWIDSFPFATQNGKYKILTTKHGVIAETDKFYKWLFISDFGLVGAPEKLRWESIKKVLLFDEYIIIYQNLPNTQTFRVFLINIETGICGRLKNTFYEEFKYTQYDERKFIEIVTNKLIVHAEDAIFEYNLPDLTKELEKQYIK